MGLLDIPAVGLVIQKGFLDVKAQTVLTKGLQGSRFIADDSLELAIDAVAAKGNMDRAVALLLMQADIVEAQGLT